MTQEEKAKAYDEALKVLHKYDGAHIMFTQDLKEEMFPELKESEDERVRKDLINYLRSILSNKKYGDKFIEDWIAWLEKQGEKKSYGQRQECVDCQFNYAGKCKGFCAMKRGEQKPAWSEEDELNIRELESLVKQVWATAEHGNDKDTIHKMSDLSFFLKTLKPQLKQEWSDVDKDILFRTIDNLKFLRDTISIDPKYAINIIDIEREINLLESIKDRVQPKQEWSEEDERMCKAIIDNIQAICKEGYFVGNIDSDELIKWLKFLKGRYAWKPSDEQMKALEHFVRSIGESGYASPYDNDTKLLYSLLFDLKKLREK